MPAPKKPRMKRAGLAPVRAPVTVVPTGTIRYGRDWGELSDLQIELLCFRDGLTVADGGLGKPEHFWNIASMLWPATSRKPFIRNPWSERMIEQWSSHRYCSVSGCASSTKTDTAAVWGITEWLSAPLDTKVLCTSTTLRESRKRIWGSIEDYWLALPGEVRSVGDLVSSFGLLKVSRSSGVRASDKCGIELIPGEKKREKEATGKIIGIKNKRVILIADELPELSPAIMQSAISNLSANPYCQAIGLGNPASYYDAHGLFATPKDGWKSINPEVFEWETIYGNAIRFDALRSPNILADDDTLFPWLPTSKRLEEAKQKMGEDSFGFWRQWRGYFPPEGGEQTIFSDTDIVFFGGDRSRVNWSGPPTPVVGADPGFTNGGDRSVLYHGLYGEEVDTGLMVLLLTGYEVAKEDMNNTATPRNFQIAREFRRIAEKHNATARNSAVDASGSPAFADIVASEWGSEVYRGQFGGRSMLHRGDRSKSTDERYGNRATELWFEARKYMEAGQIRGVCPDLARELTLRRYSKGPSGYAGGLDATVVIEPKHKIKSRTGASTDIADAFLMMFDLCRARHGFRVQKGRKKKAGNFLTSPDTSQSIYRDDRATVIPSKQKKRFGKPVNLRTLILERGAPKIFMGARPRMNFVR